MPTILAVVMIAAWHWWATHLRAQGRDVNQVVSGFFRLATPSAEANSVERVVREAAEAQSRAEAQARLETQARLEAQRQEESDRRNPVLIPAGTFLMGSPNGVGDANEHPQHNVYLDEFYIDRFEVTVAEFRKFSQEMGKGASETRYDSTDKHPVLGVNWSDAAEYCKWAGKRLPTEAEWEKAARGGSSTAWSFGNDQSQLGQYAWINSNSNSQAHAVGLKLPNQYGLYDIAGNAWEWVADWYGENYYSQSPERNPLGPESGDLRVMRGGSWYAWSDSYTRVGYRGKDAADNIDKNFGFRCASGTALSNLPQGGDVTQSDSVGVSVERPPLDPEGTWRGTVNMSGQSPYDVILRINSSGGGITAYPTLDCGGRLSGGGESDNSYKYTETIAFGKCLSSEIVFKLIDDATMSCTWSAVRGGHRYEVTAELKKDDRWP